MTGLAVQRVASPAGDHRYDVVNESAECAGQKPAADRAENHRRLDARQCAVVVSIFGGMSQTMSDPMDHCRVPLAVLLPSLASTSLAAAASRNARKICGRLLIKRSTHGISMLNRNRSALQ